jgi:uncharacterized protein YndB with AHSA1/START domain
MWLQMAEYGTSVETAASPERVWKVWSDMSTWGEWNPNVATMDWKGGFVPGSEGVMNTRAGQHHKMRLAEVQPGRSFVLETRVIPGTVFRFNCRVEPAGGKTKISQTVEALQKDGMGLGVGVLALIGEVRVHAAAVGLAEVAIDEAGLDHLVEAPRGAAVGDAGDAGEVLEAEHRVGGVAEVGEDLVPAELEACLRQEVLLDGGRHRAVGAEDAFPQLFGFGAAESGHRGNPIRGLHK